jgi:hypothetical protein
MKAIARNLGGLHEAWLESGVFGWLLVFVWLMYPVGVASIYWPSDVLGFHAWLQGLVVPHYATMRMLIVGEIFALLSLAILSLLQLCIVVMIYRRAQFYVQLWPLATFLVGVIGNGVWWLWTGHLDPFGALFGMSPIVATVACQGVCERLGAKFVFGDNRPQYEPEF